MNEKMKNNIDSFTYNLHKHPSSISGNSYSITLDRCLQFSISLGENTNLNFGISPFSIGANVGISYTNGTYINYTGFEIGPYLGGGYYNPFSLYQLIEL